MRSKKLKNKNDVVTFVTYSLRTRPQSLIAIIGGSINDIDDCTAGDVKKCIADREQVAIEDVYLDGCWLERESRETAKQ